MSLASSFEVSSSSCGFDVWTRGGLFHFGGGDVVESAVSTGSVVSHTDGESVIIEDGFDTVEMREFDGI